MKAAEKKVGMKIEYKSDMRLSGFIMITRQGSDIGYWLCSWMIIECVFLGSEIDKWFRNEFIISSSFINYITFKF